MKKLFLYLFKKYTRTEKDRIEVFAMLHERVSDQYSEQTTYGTLYISFEELLMANTLFKRVLEEGDVNSLVMIEGGLKNSFYETMEDVLNEIHKR